MYPHTNNCFPHSLLDKRLDHNLLDALYTVAIRRNVTELSICGYGIKSQMLPRNVSRDLNPCFGRMRNASNDGDLKKVVLLLSKYGLNLGARGEIYQQVRDAVDEPAV